MKIENNKFASLSYTLKEGDREGRVIETVEESAPLSFVFGAGRLLPAFEANLEGLEEVLPLISASKHQRPMVRYVRR
ncbi:MAG: hypothetical protein R2756_12510 [Bacteroidales bacterium]